LKILFLINKAGDGGSERFVLDLAEELNRRGNECVLGYCLEGPLAERAKSAGIRTVRLGLERKDFFSAPGRIAELCRLEGIDVIHAQFPRENWYALRSLKHYGRPRVVYTCHWYQDQGAKWRRINKAFSDKQFAAAAVYDGGAEVLKSNGFASEKVCVIHNGVRPGRAAQTGTGDAGRPDQTGTTGREAGAQGRAADVFECCVLSRYSPEKGLDMLLDSIKLIDTDRPLRCTIYGDGGLYDHIAGRIKTEGLEGRVVQAGYTQDTEGALMRSDLYLSPSEKEGMSLGLLEALAAGLPCVVTDTGSSKSLAEDDPRCGVCVKVGDAEGFAAAIKRYMEDGDLRRTHAGAALAKAQNYSMERVADEYLRLYENGPDSI
jgi:glycosyltransferase involved in cell wall biosynthesis